MLSQTWKGIFNKIIFCYKFTVYYSVFVLASLKNDSVFFVQMHVFIYLPYLSHLFTQLQNICTF